MAKERRPTIGQAQTDLQQRAFLLLARIARYNPEVRDAVDLLERANALDHWAIHPARCYCPCCRAEPVAQCVVEGRGGRERVYPVCAEHRPRLKHVTVREIERPEWI